MVSKFGVRAVLAFLLVVSAGTVAASYATADGTSANFRGKTPSEIMASDRQVVPPRDGITVVATDSNSWRGQRSGGPRSRAELVAFSPNGTILYYNDSHTRYWDVDPVPGTRATVEYVYADHLNASACPDQWNLDGRQVNESVWERYRSQRAHDTSACTRNGVERVNLTTGNVTPVWSRMTPGKEATRYHDVDRINATHLAVADIYLDRVFVVNTSSGRNTWTWNASSAFPTSSGGPYPEDWTHINDVSVLEDGRIMVSVRNQDQVVFLNRSTGVVEGWTLGEDDAHSTLYEQHNPDYIPREHGGPAVLVGDSENNRVVEYQRTNGTWTRTWTWRDARLQWPRDADRLPNGHTLITDSNGNRVFEVNERGKIVWSVRIAFPYEAERLGTGPESTNGPSARKANLDSRTGGPGAEIWIGFKNLLPGKYLNALMYVTPVWVRLPELTAMVVLLLGVVGWGGLELYWRTRPLTKELG